MDMFCIIVSAGAQNYEEVQDDLNYPSAIIPLCDLYFSLVSQVCFLAANQNKQTASFILQC